MVFFANAPTFLSLQPFWASIFSTDMTFPIILWKFIFLTLLHSVLKDLLSTATSSEIFIAIGPRKIFCVQATPRGKAVREDREDLVKLEWMYLALDSSQIHILFCSIDSVREQMYGVSETFFEELLFYCSFIDKITSLQFCIISFHKVEVDIVALESWCQIFMIIS